jgi:hypothetical protein
MAKTQRIDPQGFTGYEGDAMTEDPGSGTGSGFHARVTVTDETPSALASAKQKLAAQIADIEQKLTAGKEPEYQRLATQVEEFNTIFGTHIALSPLVAVEAEKIPRKCSVCLQAGHNKNNCPTKELRGAEA